MTSPIAGEREAAEVQQLPAPRLQFRWERHTGDTRYEWQCHYELVLPLQEYDIRREVYGDDGEMTGNVSELVVAMKPPTLRGSTSIPCQTQDGTRYFDAPFRDGAHAGWDAPHIGNPPLFCIAPDGFAIAKEAAALLEPVGEGWVSEEQLCALLPGPYYMDPPDGGSVTVLEQLQRMAQDAARYRWLKGRLLCADFAYGDASEACCALVFEIPVDMQVSADLDAIIGPRHLP